MATPSNKRAQADKRAPVLSVADFGPIVEATVDLRPLTVFVGPSNTGKSYLAILIYALHRFFGGHQDARSWGRRLSPFHPYRRRRSLDKATDLPREYAAPLELKSSGVRAGKVRSQLQAGARIAEHLVSGVSSIRFVPVAAHGGKLHRKQINDLAKSENEVLFQKKMYPIRLIRCGDRLVEALR